MRLNPHLANNPPQNNVQTPGDWPENTPPPKKANWPKPHANHRWVQPVDEDHDSGIFLEESSDSKKK